MSFLSFTELKRLDSVIFIVGYLQALYLDRSGLRYVHLIVHLILLTTLYVNYKCIN